MEMSTLDRWEAEARILIEIKGHDWYLVNRNSPEIKILALIDFIRKKNEIFHKILLRTPILKDSEGFELQVNQLLEEALALTRNLK